MTKGFRISFNVVGVIAFCLLTVVSFYTYLLQDSEYDIEVYSVVRQSYSYHTDDPLSGTVTFIVSTDKGVMKLQPDGLMASDAFGRIEEGKRYHVVTKGIDFPMTRQYRYIIKAKRIE